MNNDINLTDKEKSILFTALTAFHNEADEAVNSAKVLPGTEKLAKLMQWMADETKMLKLKIFGNTEPGTHDPFAYYPKNKTEKPEPVTG